MLKIHKEIKVDVRPTCPNSAVNIPIPPQDGVQRGKFSIPPSGPNEPIARDEDAFANRYLATQGSVYFRQRRSYPRTFVWRVVDDNKVLEIQAADLTKSAHENHEASLTLRLIFQDNILPSGVALADLEDHEVLSVFVITEAKQLHTLTLRPEFFRRAGAIDENVADWCKICTPAPLAFAYPHRLHASSPLELFVALDSGALMRLTRKSGDDGSQWSPITFDERPWGASFRGLVKWNNQPSIRYNGRSLDPSTANAIATTSDQAYVFAVCLNHTLKVWNLATNKLVASRDLLNRETQQNTPPILLNPAESAFIRVFNAERALDGGERYYVATYSPQDDGQFKFWAVRGGLTTPLEIEDLFGDAKLKPQDPDPTGNVFWNVADFQIKPMEEGRGMEMWVLWRHNNLYQLFSLNFDLLNLVDVWQTNWAGTALETRRDEPPPSSQNSDALDPTQKWIEFIFQPGRYPTDVLETSLAIYEEAVKPRVTPGTSSSLQERLCLALGSTVSLRKFTDTDMDFDRYGTDMDAKWRQYWQIAEDINKKRSEPLALAYDSYTDLPWVVLTDQCCLVRECSSTELVLHNMGRSLQDTAWAMLGDRWRHRNLGSELGGGHESALLLEVAISFRKSLPSRLIGQCRTALDAELFVDPSYPAPDRIVEFHERCGFAEQITDDIFDSVFSGLEDSIGLGNLTNDLFYTVIDTLPLDFPTRDSDLLSTSFGRNTVVQGALETILLTRQTLTDLLLLVIFIETEVTRENEFSFDSADLFTTLVDLLKEYEMMHWLGSKVRPWPEKSLPGDHTSMSVSGISMEDSDAPHHRVSTILEDLFAVHIRPHPADGIPQSYRLTQQIRDVLSWITRQGEVSFPNVLVYIQCDLLACNNIELASDFLRFQPSTAWSTYVKGRLSLAKSELDTAAIYFQKAAYLLSCGKAQGDLHEMSSSLLDIISVDNFHNGLPKYFQHIVTLFEHSRAFTHVADFARLALQPLESQKGIAQDSDYNSLRTDLLSRLFHASLKTCQFDQAYSALSRHTDFALQKSALTSLITSILSVSGTAGVQKLLRFPLSLTPTLFTHVDETLTSLAKKQTTYPLLHASSSAWSTLGSNPSPTTPDYDRILHAYRIARHDFRGAAEVGYRIVQRLRKIRDGPPAPSFHRRDIPEEPQQVDEDDAESKELRQELLSLINLLACVEKSNAYILVEVEKDKTPNGRGVSGDGTTSGGDVFIDSPTASSSSDRRKSSLGFGGTSSSPISPALGSHGQQQKRIVVTLTDLRREYQAELDRVSRIERGDYEFGDIQDQYQGGGDGFSDDLEAMDTL
ncbi:hypothetical protein FQN54_001391 [Arachnomyces sp. PD_36]|nr:hypothetical protein FQN54_001391 [Arachnomyces sp. PD_36]